MSADSEKPNIIGGNWTKYCTVAKSVGRSRPIWTSVVVCARVACALRPVQSIPVAIFLNHDAQSAAQTTRFRLRSELPFALRYTVTTKLFDVFPGFQQSQCSYFGKMAGGKWPCFPAKFLADVLRHNVLRRTTLLQGRPLRCSFNFWFSSVPTGVIYNFGNTETKKETGGNVQCGWWCSGYSKEQWFYPDSVCLSHCTNTIHPWKAWLARESDLIAKKARTLEGMAMEILTYCNFTKFWSVKISVVSDRGAFGFV